LSDVTHTIESCLTYDWVMSHIWMSVSPIRMSHVTHEWVMSHIWLSHVTHKIESCHTYEWVMSHIRLNHVTHMTESCHTYDEVRLSHIAQISKMPAIPALWLDSFICVTWPIHMCDMTNSYVWHDSFICVTWLIHMCDMTHSYMIESCRTDFQNAPDTRWAAPATLHPLFPFSRHTRLRGARAFRGLWGTISQKSHLKSRHIVDEVLLRISVFAPHAITRSTRLSWSSRYNFSKVPSRVFLYSRWSIFSNFCATLDYMKHAPFVDFDVQFLKSPFWENLHTTQLHAARAFRGL